MMKKRVAGERGGVGGWSEGERGVWMDWKTRCAEGLGCVDGGGGEEIEA